MSSLPHECVSLLQKDVLLEMHDFKALVLTRSFDPIIMFLNFNHDETKVQSVLMPHPRPCSGILRGQRKHLVFLASMTARYVILGCDLVLSDSISCLVLSNYLQPHGL